MPKKKAKKVVEETPEVVTDSIPLPEGVVVKFDTGIEPLGASPDLGREDLNQAFGSLTNKINEIIKKG